MRIDKILSHIQDIEIELQKDLSKYSTMKLVATGDLVTVFSKDALKSTLKILSENKIEYNILGMGANQLLPAKSSRPYIMLKFNFDKNKLDEVCSDYILPASVRLSALTSHAAKFGIKGFEVFTGIPATLGGAVFMNAGTGLGEIGSIVKKVWLINKFGEERVVDTDEASFSYRKNHFVNEGEVIYQVELSYKGVEENVKNIIKDYLQKRNQTQPMSANTCGCVFKNSSYEGQPCPAGKFIDIIGLKGLQVGGIRISDKHGNFMENFNNATYEDVKELIQIVQNEMYQQFGVRYELEVRI